MSAFGPPPPVTQSVAGAEAAERLSVRDGARKARAAKATPKKAEDADSVEVSSPEAIDPARRLAHSGDEDASHDRRRSGNDYRTPAAPGDGDEPTLDIRA